MATSSHEAGAHPDVTTSFELASNKPAAPEGHAAAAGAKEDTAQAQPAAARVASTNAVTYSNDASAAQTN